MSEMDLGAVSRLTAGAVGDPGDRTFYIQARTAETLVTLLVEKQQVDVLAQLVEQLFARLESEGRSDAGSGTDTTPPADDDLGLEEPLAPLFRVGQIAIGYDADQDLFVVQCEEIDLSEEDDEMALEDLEELEGVDDVEDLLEASSSGSVVRMWANRLQLEALARVGRRAVAAGRPTCRMCGGPIDAEGHFCPPSNGHKETDSIP